MIRSEFWVTHFWARLSTLPRPSKPSARQPGCASRPFSTSAATSSGATAGIVAIVSPVAGLLTSMLRAPLPPFAPGAPVVVFASVVVPLSTVALLRSLLV